MNAIKFFFVLSAVLFTTALKSQAAINPDIKTSLDAFINYSNQQDWDKAFSLLYPKLFNKVPKQDLVDLMVGMDSDGLSLKMSNMRITSTSVPVVEGNETFVRVEYEADIDLTIEEGGIYDHPKSIQAMQEQFVSTYGETNVRWVEDSKKYQVLSSKKSMMAIKTGNESWKLVEINMDQPALMEYLFSPSIMDALVRLE
jgi:hypothetical protein